MNIRDLNLITRKPGTKEIDVQGSLHAIAKELIAWSDEERKIRTNRRYKAAIRRVFSKYPGARIASPALIAMAVQQMKGVKVADYRKITEDVGRHIRLNHGGYLSVQSGKSGGVALIK